MKMKIFSPIPWLLILTPCFVATEDTITVCQDFPFVGSETDFVGCSGPPYDFDIVIFTVTFVCDQTVYLFVTSTMLLFRDLNALISYALACFSVVFLVLGCHRSDHPFHFIHLLLLSVPRSHNLILFSSFRLPLVGFRTSATSSPSSSYSSSSCPFRKLFFFLLTRKSSQPITFFVLKILHKYVTISSLFSFKVNTSCFV